MLYDLDNRVVIIMNIFDYYKEIRVLLENDGYEVDNYKKIQYGLQFILNDNNNFLLRIYESKKRGVILDVSQIRDDAIKSDILKLDFSIIIEKDLYNKNSLETFILKNRNNVEIIIRFLVKKGAERVEAKEPYILCGFILDGLRFTIFNNNKILMQGKSQKADSLKQNIEEIINNENEIVEVKNKVIIKGKKSMNKFIYYEEIKKALEKNGFKVGDFKIFNNHIQFYISQGGEKREVLRIYEHQEKGVNLNLTLVKDLLIKKEIEKIRSEFPFDYGLKNNEAPRESLFDYEEESDDNENIIIEKDEMIGIDESGKGDFFGPLVIAAVYIDPVKKFMLELAGAKDSKELSDFDIRRLAGIIKSQCKYSVVIIHNKDYNEQYKRYNNINKLLGWGHAKALENVLNEVECEFALSDKFGKEEHIERALMERGKNITVYQITKAERNIAVAAASILARYEFVLAMEKMSERFDMVFPKGGNNSSICKKGKDFIKLYGENKLKEVSKIHFKTIDKIIN